MCKFYNYVQPEFVININYFYFDKVDVTYITIFSSTNSEVRFVLNA